MRVLLFTTAYEPLVGGSELAIKYIARHLPDVFFDVVTPRYAHANAPHESHGNLAIYRVGFGTILDKWFFPLFGMLKGRGLLKTFHHNIIHGYQASYGSGAAWLLKKLFPQLNFVLTLQEGKSLHSQPFAIRWLRNILIRDADAVTAISTSLASHAKSVRGNSTVELIPNGVDTGLFKPLKNLNSSQDKATIITISRLVPKNGIDTLIRALVRIRAAQSAHLLIVGDGPLRASLERLTKELDLEDDVTFTGTLAHERLPQLLAQADLFVRLSRSEGLGSAFLEAMACGVPVVGCAVGGVPDFLQDGLTGLLCKPNDVDDATQKITLLLNDRNLSEKISNRSLQLVKERYNWQSIALSMREVYRRMIKTWH